MMLLLSSSLIENQSDFFVRFVKARLFKYTYRIKAERMKDGDKPRSGVLDVAVGAFFQSRSPKDIVRRRECFRVTFFSKASILGVQ